MLIDHEFCPLETELVAIALAAQRRDAKMLMAALELLNQKCAAFMLEFEDLPKTSLH